MPHQKIKGGSNNRILCFGISKDSLHASTKVGREREREREREIGDYTGHQSWNWHKMVEEALPRREN